MAILLSLLPRFTTSVYPFGILWPLYCLSFLDLRLLITPLYLVAIVLSFPPRFTTSDYPFGILWPLYCLSFLDLRLLITPLVSCGHCIFVLPRFTISNYPFGILWPLYCLSFLHLQLLITPLVTCSHCIVCPFSIYDFWLPLWYLVAIVLSVLPRFCIICPSSIYDFWLPLWYLVAIVFSVILRFCIVCHSSIYDFWLPFWYLVAIVLSFPPRFTTSDYPFGILWPLYFLSFLDLRLLISPLVSCDHCIVCHSSILYCLSFLDLRLLITLLVSFGHCNVCPSSGYDFWLSLWFLVAIVLSVLPRFTTSDNPFGILWPLYCLSFLDLRLLITPLVSCGHCIFCHSSILYCLSFLDFRLMITPLVSFGHCVVCTSSIYDLWLSFWYLVAIVLSVRPRFTTSDYPFGILWPLYCLSFLG